MTTLTEGNYTGDVVLWEEDAHHSRRAVTIASGANAADDPVKIGTVLGKITASGKYVPHAPGAGNGSETVAGVLIQKNVDAAAADAPGVIIEREAQVRRAALIFHADTDTVAERDAVCAALDALGVRCI